VRLDVGYDELNQLALSIRRQQVEGMDGEANVSHTINDDAAHHAVKVLAILMQISDRRMPFGTAVDPS
jgi:hypothetical protein